MPRNLTPEDRWETDFEVPIPGEPRRIGPLEVLFQRLLNRTERLKNRTGAILGLSWDATPPDTIAGLAGRVSTLESNQGDTTLSAHRNAATLDHPDGAVTLAKLAPAILGQPNGLPLLNSAGALAASDAYLDRGLLNSAVNWSTLTDAGTYEVASGAFGTGSANTPPAVAQQGHLVVFKTSGVTTQIYIPKGSDPGIYRRQYAGGTWSPWATAGAVYGSNSNGSYIRFADGTQICWASHSDSSFNSIVIGNDTNYKYRPKYWLFPAAFANTPVVTSSGDIEGARVDILNSYDSSTTQCTIEVGQYNTSTIVVTSCYTLAIGRWK